MRLRFDGIPTSQTVHRLKALTLKYLQTDACVVEAKQVKSVNIMFSMWCVGVVLVSRMMLMRARGVAKRDRSSST